MARDYFWHRPKVEHVYFSAARAAPCTQIARWSVGSIRSVAKSAPTVQKSFSHVKPLPQSRGEFTRSGTIAEFLATQEAHPFMQAADDYFFWLCAARECLEEASNGEATNVAAEDEDVARDLLDMDATIGRHCAATDVAEPTDIEARRELHLTILYRQLEQTTGGRHERT